MHSWGFALREGVFAETKEGLIQSSQDTATCDVSSPRQCEVRGDRLQPFPLEIHCSDGNNAGEILGHSERWSKNPPLVSGSVGESPTSIRVVN
jgi:hypothetical protein